jgi:DNA anti-recombination protein RmuC
MGEEQLEDEGLRARANLADSREAIKIGKEFKDRYLKLEEKRDYAKEEGYIEKAEEIQDEIHALADEFEKQRKKDRIEVDAGLEKIRKTVSKSLRQSLRKIEQKHKSLGEYFSRTIKTGIRSSYRPLDSENPIVPWDT